MSGGERSVDLAIETSTQGGSVALQLTGRGPIERHDLDAEASHGADLMPVIAERLGAHGLAPGALRLVVIGRGPGSYTGLRVGAATALGLVRGTGAALVGVPSFDALAADAAGNVNDPTFALVRNAFGGCLYVGIYRNTQEGADAVARVESLTAREAKARLEDVRVILGDATAARLLAAEGRDDVAIDARSPRADALLRLGLRRFDEHGDEGPAAATPLYLRPFEVKIRKR